MANPQSPYTKPQLPPPGVAPSGREWRDIWTGFGTTYRYLQSLILYLQDYLTKTYNALVPTSLVIVNIDNTESPYTVGATEGFIAASAGAGADTTINLPAAAGTGRVLVVIKIDANAHNVIIAANGSDTINNAATVTLAAQYDVVRIIDQAAGVWLKW